MLVDFTVSDIRSAGLRDFYECWLDLAEEGPPLADDLILENFGRQVGTMLRGDLDPSTGRLIIRFVGAETTDRLGTDYTGSFADEAGDTDVAEARTAQVFETGKPLYTESERVRWGPNNFLSYDAVIVPLFASTGKVVSVLYGVDFHAPDRRA